jgi:hypothetical protein
MSTNGSTTPKCLLSPYAPRVASIADGSWVRIPFFLKKNKNKNNSL